MQDTCRLCALFYKAGPGTSASHCAAATHTGVYDYIVVNDMVQTMVRPGTDKGLTPGSLALLEWWKYSLPNSRDVSSTCCNRLQVYIYVHVYRAQETLHWVDNTLYLLSTCTYMYIYTQVVAAL